MPKSETDKRSEFRAFQAAAESGSGLEQALADVHIADVAEWLQELEEEAIWRVFGQLRGEQRSELLEYASDSLREALLERLPAQELAPLIEDMPADDAVDLLALASDHKTEQTLRSVDFERARGLRRLAAFDAETAGGLMTTDYVSVPLGARVGDAIKELKSEEGPAGEEDFGIFVVDEHGHPVGHASDRDLLTHSIHTEIGDAMETGLMTVSADDDQEDVAHLVQKYDLAAVPVVDRNGVLIGVVSADDALGVLEEEAEEDIRKLVGTSTEEQTRLPVLIRVRGRLPLQGLTVAGGLVTAYILDRAMPSGERAETTELLRYLPIIIGLAGNVGIQSSTILVRAFATGEVTEEREMSVLSSEVLVGFLIGLVCGLVTMLVAPWLEKGGPGAAWTFGLAIGVAIWVAVSWASLLGCAVPVACRRLGIDPAVVAGPFLITLSDVSGAAIFVVVARVLLGALVT